MSEIVNAKELESAQKEAAQMNSGVYVHKFKTPFEFEGKVYTELSFNWNKLTGADALAIEDEMSVLGKVLINPAFSGQFLIRMAIRACDQKIGSDLLKKLSLQDYNRIRSRARSFLLVSE